MASIQEVKNRDGSTSYRIQVLINGCRKSKTIKPKETAPTKVRKEIKEAAAEFERSVKVGTDFSDGNKVKFSDLINSWNNYELAARTDAGNIGEQCREKYLTLIRLYVAPVIGNMYVTKIRPANIQEVITKMLDSGKAPKTIRNTFNCTHQAFDYAFRNDLIPFNPCDKVKAIPKASKHNKLHIFNSEQTQRFLTDALEVDIPRSDSWKKQEDKVFFTLSLFGGFRKGELCALTWNDIDLDSHTITINKAVGYDLEHGEYIKEPKTESGNRKVKLPAACFTLLRSWKQTCKEICIKSGVKWQGSRGSSFDNNYIFIRSDGSRISNREPYKRFKLILDAYNDTVSDDMKLPDIRLHDLRHTNASHLVAAGTDIETVARRLGHSRASFTLDIYAEALEEKDESAADALEQIFTAGASR